MKGLHLQLQNMPPILSTYLLSPFHLLSMLIDGKYLITSLVSLSAKKPVINIELRLSFLVM